MTMITIFVDNKQNYTGFEVSGHAGYAQAGEDIVCAAISVLVTTTINSIEEFTDDFFGYEEDEKSGYMSFTLEETSSAEAQLLLRSMVLGLSQISKQYDSYCKMIIREV